MDTGFLLPTNCWRSCYFVAHIWCLYSKPGRLWIHDYFIHYIFISIISNDLTHYRHILSVLRIIFYEMRFYYNLRIYPIRLSNSCCDTDFFLSEYSHLVLHFFLISMLPERFFTIFLSGLVSRIAFSCFQWNELQWIKCSVFVE